MVMHALSIQLFKKESNVNVRGDFSRGMEIKSSLISKLSFLLLLFFPIRCVVDLGNNYASVRVLLACLGRGGDSSVRIFRYYSDHHGPIGFVRRRFLQLVRRQSTCPCLQTCPPWRRRFGSCTADIAETRTCGEVSWIVSIRGFQDLSGSSRIFHACSGIGFAERCTSDRLLDLRPCTAAVNLIVEIIPSKPQCSEQQNDDDNSDSDAC